MDGEELESLGAMGQAVATMALQNSVDAINAVFGPGSAKLDTPLVASAFAAQTQFLSGMIAAASMVMGDDDDDGDDENDEFELNS